MSKEINPGDIFGRWKTIEHKSRIDKNGWNVDGWICKCECGTQKWVSSNSLKSGKSKSCGCYISDMMKSRDLKHGMSNTKEYKTYFSMIDRCYDPNHRSYKYYGGRGIRVCDRWNTLENFLSDAPTLIGYEKNNKNLSLDRIDPNKDYEPENCRWVTKLKQQNNKRNNIFVDWNGEKITLAELSRLVNVPYKNLVSSYYVNKDKLSIYDIVEKTKKRLKRINIAELSGENNVPYNKLYHLIIVKGKSIDESLSILSS